MKVFVVTAHRWGDRETHNYLVGVFSEEWAALIAAGEEENWRGGKYECLVQRVPIDETGSESVTLKRNFEIIKSLPPVPTNVRRAPATASNPKPRGVNAYPKHRGENHLRKELDKYTESGSGKE